jgi:hypothetical protein
MACPLRLVVFFFSALLLLAALAHHATGGAGLVHARPERSWAGFLRALFTGELLYDAYYGAGAWRGEGEHDD